MNYQVHVCRFCKGTNPCCHECSTMGIGSEGNIKSVSVIESNVQPTFSNYRQKPKRISWSLPTTKKEKKKCILVLRLEGFKKLNKSKKKTKAACLPTLGDKYALLLNNLKTSLQ